MYIWVPDNPGFNQGMMPMGGEPASAKDLRKIAAWLDQQKAIAKKKEKHKPRQFTGLEAWGMTVLFGPFVYTLWYYGIEVLAKIGQQYILNLNVPH